MNPIALLGLLSDLYTQITQLTEENQQLKNALEASIPADAQDVDAH